MKKLSKSDTQFLIDQLRKEKLIYALESTALTMLAILLFSGLQFIAFQFPQISPYLTLIAQALLAVPLLFWLFAIAGNIWRCFQIKNLEKTL